MQDQKIAACGSSYMRLPPTGENGRLAGRHREQALLLQKQKPDQKIAACGSSYMRLPPTEENGRLAGRHRWQASSHRVFVQSVINRLAAIASKLCSYEEQKQNAHRFCFSPLNTMSASSGELLILILIHGRRRKAEWRD
jgi:hypothetical protein